MKMNLSHLLLVPALLISAAAPSAAQIPRAPAPGPAVNPASAASVEMGVFRDPWPAARPRWWDISNAPARSFEGFLNGTQEFSYENSYSNPAQTTRVVLSYDTAPNVPYFVGHIRAEGLKPNFAYQIKIAGKPIYGARGHGPHTTRNAAGQITVLPDGGGEDWANEQLGRVGRWWCDTQHASQTNFDDSHYQDAYKGAAPGEAHSLYGYIFAGVFVTDGRGRANVGFTGRNSYHITWASWQDGIKDVEEFFSPFSTSGHVISSAPTQFYGYGATAPTASTRLYYEYEYGRPRNNVRLPPGEYRCRILLTEETFHNSDPEGGTWSGVLATEDHRYSASGALLGPDTVAANDVVFRIGSPATPPAPSNLSATRGQGQVLVTWAPVAGAAYYRVQRAAPGGAWSTIGGGAPASGTSFADATAAANTAYRYRVFAVAAGVAGAASAEAAVSAPSPNPTATPAPTAVPTPTSTAVPTATPTQVPATPTPLPTARPTATPRPVPAAPSGLTARAQANGTVALAWRDNAVGESGFKIERSLNGVRWVQVQQTGPNAQAAVVAGLDAATTYFFRVRAWGAGGHSAFSNAARVTTARAVPVAPSGLVARGGPGTISLRWRDNSSNERGFVIERQSGRTFSRLALLAPNSTEMLLRVAPNTTEVLRVRAFNAAGLSPASNTASATSTIKAKTAR